MIRVADYVAATLVREGIRTVFMITGGGAMHLNDALGNHPDLRVVACHHEQACAIAAEGHFRASGRMAAVNVTSGPGGTNALTGVLGQWTDSIPALYLSGQVKRETTLAAAPGLPLRQLGDQECDIIALVKPITKFAVSVTRPEAIRQVLEQALRTAREGRPGPVWIDLPLDVQGALVDPEALEGLQAEPKSRSTPVEAVGRLLDLLEGCARPVLIAGHGIRLAGAQVRLLATAEALGIPMLTTFNGFDLVPTDHPLLMGHPGTLGTRAGNFALQNADLVLAVGTRNNIRQVSYNWGEFARSALKVVVDVDPAELDKPTLRPDLPILADAGDFLAELATRAAARRLPDWSGWAAWCAQRRERYPVVPFDHPREGETLDPYLFMEALGQELPEGAIVVAGNGTACVALFQAGIVKEAQRQFWNSGCASMGYDLPSAIGASIARPGEPVVCLAGDGSLQMNLQELQTLAHHRLPVKLFVLGNGGYQSIRQTQDAFFGGRHVACNAESGISFPDITALAGAFGLPATRIASPRGLPAAIRAVLATDGPHVCDLRLDTTYTFKPKLSSLKLPDGRMISKPLEDMFPFLPPGELQANLLEPPRSRHEQA